MKKGLIVFFISIFLLSILFITSYAQQKPIGTGQVIPKLNITKFRTIDFKKLQSLQTPIGRSIMLQSLMDHPATRSILENVVKRSKVPVNELQSKDLDGKSISPTPQGQHIEQLNWNAGIKFSMIKYRPKFYHPQTNRTIPLGIIGANVLANSEHMPFFIENDIFPIGILIADIKSRVDLFLYLPSLNPANYMIGIQTIESYRPPEVVIVEKHSRSIQVTPLTSGDGYVGVTQISPSLWDGIPGCQIMVSFNEPMIYFGGFTITRL